MTITPPPAIFIIGKPPPPIFFGIAAFDSKLLPVILPLSFAGSITESIFFGCEEDIDVIEGEDADIEAAEPDIAAAPVEGLEETKSLTRII